MPPLFLSRHARGRPRPRGWGGYDDEQDDGHADLGRGSVVSATAGHPLPLPHDQSRGIYARNALLWHYTNHYAPADAGDTASGAIYSRLERLRVTDLGSEWHASRELQRELSTAIPALSYLGDCIDYVEEALAELAEPGPALSRRAVAERLGPLSVQLTSIYSHINERIDELNAQLAQKRRERAEIQASCRASAPLRPPLPKPRAAPTHRDGLTRR